MMIWVWGGWIMGRGFIILVFVGLLLPIQLLKITQIYLPMPM